MRRLLATIVLMVAMVLPQQLWGRDFSNETLHYEIVYHWGVIWKHAADATLSIRKTSNGYQSQARRAPGPTRSIPCVTPSSAP